SRLSRRPQVPASREPRRAGPHRAQRERPGGAAQAPGSRRLPRRSRCARAAVRRAQAPRARGLARRRGDRTMIVIAGGDLVLPDRIISGGALVLDGPHIVAIESTPRVDTAGAEVVDVRQCYVVPGFVDVHVHGLGGIDLFDHDAAVAEIAARMPEFGVTAFCPTSIACEPVALRGFLAAVGRARLAPAAHAARVLPAHLESNFLNPEFAGAQPLECLRVPADLAARSTPLAPGAEPAFSGREIL